jgi:hypothetical protein
LSTLKLWLLIAGAVLLALLGVRTHYQRQLEAERERTEGMMQDALTIGDHAAADRHAAELRAIDLELRAERRLPWEARVADAVAEARRRATR